MAFSFSLEKTDDIAVLHLAGRLVDKVEAVEISVEIDEELAQGTHRFVIELNELEYMNSTGLNILLNLMNKTKNQGGEALVVGANPRIKSLFSVTKLDSVFTIKENRQEAFAYFTN